MLGLVAITIGVGWVVTQVGYLDTEIYFPIVDVNIDLDWFYFPFLFVVIAGTANGVNLTDGIDGLAAGTCAISLLTFLAIAAISWIRSGPVGVRSDNYLDVAIFTAALIGGVIGFLWFNAFPAEVFMGDTGSMALGGAIAALADDPDRGAAHLHRRHLPDRGAVVDDPGRELQAHRQARLPDGADPPSLRDEGVVRDEDHGALLDRRSDPLHDRVRALLPLLPPLQALVPARAARAAVPITVAVLVMVVWGATPIVTRLALDDLEPLVVAAAHRRRGPRRDPADRAGAHALPADRRHAAAARDLRLAGFVIFPVVYTVGQERTSALHGVMILAALPIFTGLYATLVARPRPGRAWLAGCAVALAGEVVLIGGRAAGEGSGGDATLAGDLLVLAAALVVSAGYVAGAMLPPRGVSSLAATSGAFCSGRRAGPARGGAPRERRPAGGRRDGLGGGAVPRRRDLDPRLLRWYWALDRGGIQRIATLQFLQPVSGFVLAALVLGEHVTVPIAVGSALIVAGIVIAQRA